MLYILEFFFIQVKARLLLRCLVLDDGLDLYLGAFRCISDDCGLGASDEVLCERIAVFTVACPFVLWARNTNRCSLI